MDFAWCNSPSIFSKEIYQISAFFNAQKIIENFADGKYSYKLKNDLHDRRKAEYIAGRFCALKILNSLDIACENISSNEDRTPIWPPNILGSITHSENYVSVSITNNSSILGIGRDSEFIFPKMTAEKVKPIIIQDDELELINGLKKEEFLSLIYSAKESFYKAVYPSTKKPFYFDDVSILEINDSYFKIKAKKNLGPFFKTDQIFKGEFIFSDGLVHTGIIIKKDDLN